MSTNTTTALLLLFLLPLSIVSAVPSQFQAQPSLEFGVYSFEIDHEGRLHRSRDGWTTAEDISARVPGVKGVQGFVRLAAFALDPHTEGRVVAVGADDLYISPDSGSTWQALSIKDLPTINRSLKFTAVAVSPHNPDHLLLGTSYHGFYESTDGGQTFRRVSTGSGFAFMDRGAGFHEEVSALSFDPVDRNLLYFELGFGEGSFSYNRVSGELRPLPRPGTLHRNLGHLETARPELDSAAALRRERAANRTGLYIAAHRARQDLLPAYLDLLQEHGMNSIVVDFKDDFGMLRYASTNATAQAAGAVRPLFDAEQLIAAAHERKIYVIARVVVFQDPRLYAYDNHRYAIWDSRRDRPWGVFRSTEEGQRQVESWVDPYSEFVRRYNVEIAREIQDLGVDEIQFDYIRFPSDGATADILTRFRPENTDRVAALSSFLAAAREALHLPIGVDVYGFNAWYRTVYLGQDIEEMARYVDVISPMLYPSHFPRSFYGELEYLDWAEFIYREGSRRSAIIAGTTLIRPYIQAFLIGGELQFSTSYYRSYLLRQLEGSRAGGASGFTLWNASGRYYMIGDSLRPYTLEEDTLEDQERSRE